MQKNVNAKKYLMDKILSERDLEHIKSEKMYKRNIMNFLLVLDLEFWQDEKYRNLLMPLVWHSSIDNIIGILTLDCWEEPMYAHLFTPLLFKYKAKNIKDNLELFTKLDIVNYVRTYNFRRSATQNSLLIKALQDKFMPIIVQDHLNPIFGYSNGRLKSELNIDLELLEAEYMERKGQKR